MEDNKKMMSILEEILKTVKGLEKRMDSIEKRMDKIESRMDKIEKRMDKLESRFDKFERYTCNEFQRLEKKIDFNFKYLDKKIDSTKEKIISATIDEMERFSNAASRLINNVDSKLQTETKERIFEIEKLNNVTEYDKIVLKNLESRVSILEEESQRYNEN